MNDARERAIDALARATHNAWSREKIGRDDEHQCADCTDDASLAIDYLERDGYSVVPTSLVTNAQTVLDRMVREASCCDECGPYIDPERDALAASLAEARGDDPLNVYAGKA